MDYETQIAVRDAEAAIVRFLVREKKKFEAAADDAKLPGESKQRCAVRASLLATLIEQIRRGDHHLPE